MTGHWGTRAPEHFAIVRQQVFELLKIGDFCPDALKMMRGDFPHFGAGGLFRPSEREQGTDLGKREPELAGTPDEGERARVRRPVDAAAVGGASGTRHHPDPLVIPNRLDVHSGKPGELADGQVLRSRRRDARHELEALIL